MIFGRFFRYFYSILILATAFLFLFLTVGTAYAAENEKCEINSRIGALYYDFDKIVVVIYGLSNSSSNKELSFESLKERITKILSNNFHKCLLMNDGSFKKIEVHRGFNKDILDEDNLGIFLRVGTEFDPAKEPTGQKITIVQYGLFRAGLDPSVSYLATEKMRTAIIHSHASPEVVGSELDYAFEQISPTYEVPQGIR